MTIFHILIEHTLHGMHTCTVTLRVTYVCMYFSMRSLCRVSGVCVGRCACGLWRYHGSCAFCVSAYLKYFLLSYLHAALGSSLIS